MTSSLSRKLAVSIERWPIAGTFTISRGAKTEAVTVVADVSQDGHTGRGECVPYARYGETPEATLEARPAMQERCQGADRDGPAGGDAGRRGAQRAGLRALGSRGQARREAGLDAARPAGAAPLTTAYTICLGTPEAMAARPRRPRAGRC